MTNLLIVAFATILLSSGGESVLRAGGGSECRQLGPCRCEYKDGMGIDLTSVVETSGAYLEAMDPISQDKFFFHPCADIKYLPDQPPSDNECSAGNGYTLCRWDAANKTYHKLATIKDSSFHSDESGQEYLVFKKDSLVTSVTLFCLNGNSDRSFIFTNRPLQTKVGAENETSLLLFSPHACPITIEVISKPSTGSVLLILFLIGTFTYFTIGSIVRFMYLGARGIEVIPNLEFWQDLPALVRDGIRFVQNGCRVERAPDPDSYDAI